MAEEKVRQWLTDEELEVLVRNGNYPDDTALRAIALAEPRIRKAALLEAADELRDHPSVGLETVRVLRVIETRILKLAEEEGDDGE